METVKNKNGNMSRSKQAENSSAIAQILNGEFLTKDFVLRNLNFIFFIIFLLLLSVSEGYYGKQLFEEVEAREKEIEEITAEYVEAKAKLEEITQRQVLIDKLEQRGLKETVNPTKVIRIQADDNKN